MKWFFYNTVDTYKGFFLLNEHKLEEYYQFKNYFRTITSFIIDPKPTINWIIPGLLYLQRNLI